MKDEAVYCYDSKKSDGIIAMSNNSVITPDVIKQAQHHIVQRYSFETVETELVKKKVIQYLDSLIETSRKVNVTGSQLLMTIHSELDMMSSDIVRLNNLNPESLPDIIRDVHLTISQDLITNFEAELNELLIDQLDQSPPTQDAVDSLRIVLIESSIKGRVGEVIDVSTIDGSDVDALLMWKISGSVFFALNYLYLQGSLPN